MKNLILVLLLFSFNFAMAQKGTQDVIYLKNGSIIRGTIIEQVPNEYVKIEMYDRSVFVYKMEDIEKIVKEPIKPTSKSKTSASSTELSIDKGYKLRGELGFGVEVGKYGESGLNMSIINDYQLNSFLAFGLGTGFRYFFSGPIHIPLYAHMRAGLPISPVAPYFDFGVGYSYDASNDFFGVGAYYTTSFGVNFNLTDNYLANVGLGADIQNMSMLVGSYYYANRIYFTSSAITLNFGITF